MPARETTDQIPEDRITRLVEIVRKRRDADRSDWSPTPLAKELESLAAQLDAMADLLAADGPAQTMLEQVHNERRQFTDAEGYPAEGDTPERYGAAVVDLRELAESARVAIKQLPDSRAKTALPTAALGVCLLYQEHSTTPPKLYERGDAVALLDRVCKAAGLPYSPERLKDALRNALRTMDSHHIPAELHDLFD